MASTSPAARTDKWPSGPLSGIYHDQRDELDAWHCEVAVAKVGVMEAEKKVGIDLSFAGDLPVDDYQFVVSARYFPPYFDLKLPYQVGLGVGIKREWGDFRIQAFGQIPEFIAARGESEDVETPWRAGALVQAFYNLYESDYFRVAVTGEAGMSAGAPERLVSHIGFGLLGGLKL